MPLFPAARLPAQLEVQQGTTWRDGKLYYFHPQFIEVLKIWPRPRAWRKDAGGSWQHTLSGHFSYTWHQSSAQGLQAIAERHATDTEAPPHPATLAEVQRNPRLRRRLPDWEVWRAIPERVGACLLDLGGRGWHLLTLLAHVPEAVELAESNRAVAWILASSRDFVPCAQPMRRARRLVQLPRRDLLARLGWPRRKAVVRLLGKVTPPALCRVGHLLHLRDRCHDEAFLNEAGHLSAIGGDLLRLLGEPALADLARPALWREVAAMPEKPHTTPVAGRLATAVELAADLGLGLAPVASVRQVDDVLARLVRGLDAVAAKEGLRELDFGEPPLPPPDGLPCEPLRTWARLRHETATMHHCIASPFQRYVHAIRAGTGYAFHLDRPEATVFVEREAGRWVLAELKGPCNAAVPGWLVARLRQWLAAAQGAKTGGDELGDIEF